MQVSVKCKSCGSALNTDTSMVMKHVNCSCCAREVYVPLTNVPVGAVQGDYWIVRSVGSGNISETYVVKRGEDERLYMKVLTRAVTANKQRTTRFLKSFRDSNAVTHPNVLPIDEIGEILEHYFLTFPLVEGEFIDKLVDKNGPMKQSDALNLALQAAKILHVCWDDCGKYHGAIRPSNLLIGDDQQLHLADFGSYKSLLLGSDDSLDAIDFGGSVADYMSPEQINRSPSVDYRSDIYSLGATLYHLCTGQKPYEGVTLDEITGNHLNAPVPNASRAAGNVDPGVSKLIRSMMAKDPNERIQSWSKVIEQIRAVGKRTPTNKAIRSAPRTGSRIVARAPRSSSSGFSLNMVIGLLVALVLVACVGFIWIASQQHDTSNRIRKAPPAYVRHRKPPPKIKILPKPRPKISPPKAIETVVMGLSLTNAQGEIKSLLTESSEIKAKADELIRVRADTMGDVASVAFYLDGDPTPHIKNDAPFTLLLSADPETADASLTFGKHVIEAKPFTKKDAQGTPGRSFKVEISFTEFIPPPPPVIVEGLSVMNTKKKSSILLVNNAELRTKEGDLIRIRANTTGPVASIAFYVDGKPKPCIKNDPPFVLLTGLKAEKADIPLSPSQDVHVIEARPFPEKNAKGPVGKPYKIRIYVTDTTPKPPQEQPVGPISFVLVDADRDVEIGPLKEGDTIDQKKHPSFNIAVKVKKKPAYITFTSSDKPDKPRKEANPPYAFGMDTDGDYHACELKPGKLWITVRTYNRKKKIIDEATINLVIGPRR